MKLQFSILDFFKTIIRKSFRMKIEGVNAIINRGEEKLIKKMDILYLFKKIHQFKFLKKQIFTDKQLKYFDYRPLLSFKTLQVKKQTDSSIYNKKQPLKNEKVSQNVNKDVEIIQENSQKNLIGKNHLFSNKTANLKLW